MQLAKVMPVLGIARLVGEHDTLIWRMVNHYVDRARRKADHSAVTQVGMDETAARRGHDYVPLRRHERAPGPVCHTGKGMDDDQQQQSFDRPDERYAVWIVEDQLGGLEIDPVFVEVPLVFLLVPLEIDRLYVQISTYILPSISPGAFRRNHSRPSRDSTGVRPPGRVSTLTLAIQSLAQLGRPVGGSPDPPLAFR